MTMFVYAKKMYLRFNQLRGRRIFIVPTRFGLLYGLFVLLILLGAINYSNSLGHILSFLLASMAFIIMLHTYRNLAKIELKHVSATSVFCGQRIPFSLILSNRHNHPCYYLEIRSRQQVPDSWNPFTFLFAYHSPHWIPQLKSQTDTRIHYFISSLHRGKQSLGKVRIASRFPLGLYETWTYFNTQEEVIIYPKPEGILPLPESRTYKDNDIKASQRKGMDDFSGFNRYRYGDPIHTIAWKTVARDDILRTKQFNQYSGGGSLMLSWSDVDSLKDIEVKLSQLCQWIIEAENKGMHYGLELPDKIIPVSHGKQHRHQCLTALALYE